MDLQTIKLDLINWITSLNDSVIIDKVKSIKEKNHDWFDLISAQEKEAIQKGLDDLNQGRTVTHQEVMQKVAQKINTFKTQ